MEDYLPYLRSIPYLGAVAGLIIGIFLVSLTPVIHKTGFFIIYVLMSELIERDSELHVS
jgi:predicted PurR-regulated permease PerM